MRHLVVAIFVLASLMMIGCDRRSGNASTGEPPVTLSHSLEPLQNAFNSHPDEPRALLLLSPT